MLTDWFGLSQGVLDGGSQDGQKAHKAHKG